MPEIQTSQFPPDIVVLEVAGRVTIGKECKQLESAIDGLRDEHKKKIIIDLSGVTHLDSTGVGLIMMASGHLKEEGGELRLAGANKHIEHLLKVTGIDKLVPWKPTVAEAALGL